MSAVSSRLIPFSRREKARRTSSPSPKEEDRESTMRSLRWGNSPSSCWAAMQED